jgi:hypothetical protein
MELSSNMSFMWDNVWDNASDTGKLVMIGVFPFWYIGLQFCFVLDYLSKPKVKMNRLHDIV